MTPRPAISVYDDPSALPFAPPLAPARVSRRPIHRGLGLDARDDGHADGDAALLLFRGASRHACKQLREHGADAGRGHNPQLGAADALHAPAPKENPCRCLARGVTGAADGQLADRSGLRHNLRDLLLARHCRPPSLPPTSAREPTFWRRTAAARPPWPPRFRCCSSSFFGLPDGG